MTFVEFRGLSCAGLVLTKLLAEGPKTCGAAGGTDPDCERAMTDGLAVIGDCDIRLKSGMSLVSSNGSTSGLVGRISADPNSLRGGTSYTFMHRLYNTVIKRTSQSTM